MKIEQRGARVSVWSRRKFLQSFQHVMAEADKVEAAYRRGDLFEKRRRLMNEWARYCASPKRPGDVVPLQGGRRG
jgi:hypothetical protein